MPTHARIHSVELPHAVPTKDVKANEGSNVRPGFVLTQSPSAVFIAGDNVGTRNHHVLFAKAAGLVSYKTTKSGQFEVSIGNDKVAKPKKAAAPKPEAKAAPKPKAASKKKEAFESDAPAPTNLMSSAPDAIDDLKKVSGIGPVFEKRLNALGVYLYSQLAAFSERDVEWLAVQMESYPDRIANDEWLAQAADLAAGKPSSMKG
jgi:predicted flap endonuclease-1-like 5' DNA nuclease